MEAALGRLALDLGEIALRRERRMAVERGMGVGADDRDVGAGAVPAPHAGREARQEVEALTLRRRDPGAGSAAPVEDKGEGRIALDRGPGQLLQPLRIVRLLALECPGIEGLHQRVGARRRRDRVPQGRDLVRVSVEQARNRAP